MPKAKLAPTFRLNNGTEMPMVGLGTFTARNAELYNVVIQAIEYGYRHFDTAFIYGNEEEIGQALYKQISTGKVKREELFIVTKLPNQHHDPKLVEQSCRQSLSRLGLNYVDLYLMHTPMGETEGKKTDYLDTWHAMENLVKIGLTKGIGVSNFNSQQIQRILDNSSIKPVCNQVECHPGFNQKKLIEFCRQRNIVIVAYSPLGRPDPKREMPNYIYGPRIKNLSEKYKKTPAQLCLRYLVQIGTIPIPKTVHENRMKENFNIFDFKISKEDMEIMDGFNTPTRWIPFSILRHHENYPFNIPY